MISPREGELINNHEYHHGQGWSDLISSTRFKAFYGSPAEYRWPMPRKDKPEYTLGTAVHTAILEPDRFAEAVILPEYQFRTKSSRACWGRWLREQGAECVDDTPSKDDVMDGINELSIANDTLYLNIEQHEKAQSMALSVRESPDAVEALQGGIVERSFRANGRKARPDCLNPPLLVDLKTSSKFDRFEWSARDLRYPESLAWYERVLADCGISIQFWIWIVIESTPYRLARDGFPRHRVRVWLADDELRRTTIEDMEHALERLAECERTDEWPGYQPSVATLYGK